MRHLLGVALLTSVWVGGPIRGQEKAHQAHPPYPAQWNPKAQELFLSYWTVEPGWSTELEIRNNVAWRDLSITPVLRMPAGAEIALEPVTVPPEHVTSIDLREEIGRASCRERV